MTDKASVQWKKAFTAEATVFELSWAIGSGLPICCISGLTVAEAGMGEWMQGPEGSHSLQTFWEQLLDFYKAALWTSETVMGTNRGPARKCVHLCARIPKRHEFKLVIKVVIPNICWLFFTKPVVTVHFNNCR